MNIFKIWFHIPSKFEGHCLIQENEGDQYWLIKDKIIHREDGPAIIYSHGTKVWYNKNKKHRLDGPAIESDKKVLYFITEKQFWNHPLVIQHMIDKIIKL